MQSALRFTNEPIHSHKHKSKLFDYDNYTDIALIVACQDVAIPLHIHVYYCS